MPALQAQIAITTLHEYEALPEDTRAEVFDGQIFYFASPSQDHQTISMELSTVLNSYVKKNTGFCKVFSAPFDVLLSEEPLTIVQPDLMVICDKNKLDGKRCNGAPDWIIEIVSPSSRRMDYMTKLFKYRSAGVREYWIVDPDKNRILIYEFSKEDTGEYTFSDTVKVGIYDDLYIDFSQIEKAF